MTSFTLKYLLKETLISMTFYNVQGFIKYVPVVKLQALLILNTRHDTYRMLNRIIACNHCILDMRYLSIDEMYFYKSYVYL